MTLQIRSIERNDIEPVSKFLISGFSAPVDAEFAAPDVLEWKYFDVMNDAVSPKNLIALDGGDIVGFVGVSATQFVLGRSMERVSAGHGMDWIASPTKPAVGVFISERAHESIAVPFVIGGTPNTVAIRKRMGWKFPRPVPVYYKALRPTSRLRRPRKDSLLKTVLKIGRDYVRRAVNPSKPPAMELEIKPVTTFGDEVELVTRACGLSDIHTHRTAGLLNHLLRYPRAGFSGWLLMQNAKVRGFGVLSVLNRGEVWLGRIVDCFMDDPGHDLWHSALHCLTRQLRILGADQAVSYGSTSWMEKALQNNGYHIQYKSPLMFRDLNHLIPEDASFLLTPLESDHGYL